MSAPTAEQVARWRRTLVEHSGHRRCPEWVYAFTSLIQADRYHPAAHR